MVDIAINEQTGFATVTMQRLPVNSLNLELLTQLSEAFDQVQENKCKGMILTSVSKICCILYLFKTWYYVLMQLLSCNTTQL